MAMAINRFKFRFWNPEEKRFEYDLLDSRTTYQNPFLREDIIPCQFTGLLDKQGKEIYEGDILSAKGRPNMEIVWNQDRCKFEFNIKPEGDIHWEVLPDLFSASKFWEVIGNICENPELI